ncbi:MAG TPA: aldehyde dehydrogenase family protein [Actinoplanes sp.]
MVNIVGGGRGVGRHLVAHPDIDKVSFTGSTAAGRRRDKSRLRGEWQVVPAVDHLERDETAVRPGHDQRHGGIPSARECRA